MDNAKAILEGLLFLSGEEGLTMDQMMHGLQNLEMDDIRVLLDALKKEYSSSSKGIELVEYANRFKNLYILMANNYLKNINNPPFHRLPWKL